MESSPESILTTSEAFVLEEGISIIFTVSLGSSTIWFSSALSSTAHASRASRSSESKVAPGNLCLATSRKVLGKDSEAASLSKRDAYAWTIPLGAVLGAGIGNAECK